MVFLCTYSYSHISCSSATVSTDILSLYVMSLVLVDNMFVITVSVFSPVVLCTTQLFTHSGILTRSFPTPGVFLKLGDKQANFYLLY